MVVPRIDTQTLTTDFDPVQRVVYIRFSGSLTPDIVTRLYDWINALTEALGAEHIRGVVNDMRGMRFLQSYSLGMLAKASRKANAKHDFSHLPTAYIVSSLFQDQIARMAIRVAPNRRAIVHSDEEALRFIDDWHKQHTT